MHTAVFIESLNSSWLLIVATSVIGSGGVVMLVVVVLVHLVYANDACFVGTYLCIRITSVYVSNSSKYLVL
jgi:hypothetical protein